MAADSSGNQSDTSLKPGRKVWRSKSVLHLLKRTPSKAQEEEEEESIEDEGRLKKRLGIVFCLVLVVFILGIERIQSVYSRTLWFILLGVIALVFRMAAPEIIGQVLGYVVTKFALYNEIALHFKGVRIAPWLEIIDKREKQTQEPYLSRPRTHFVAQDQIDNIEEEVGQKLSPKKEKKKRPLASAFLERGDSIQDEAHNYDRGSSINEEEQTVASEKSKDAACHHWLWCVLKRIRICIEIRVKQFAMTQPDRHRSGSDWCRDRFVTGTEIEIVVSMNIIDAFKLIHLPRVWSWCPRDQPIRPSDDGNGTKYGAVRDPKTKTLRNRTMLGVIEIERFDLCDATVAFEQADGQLNVCAVGAAVARAELEIAAAKALIKKKISKKKDDSNRNDVVDFVLKKRPNRLRVDVMAARNLDTALQMNRHPDGIDSKEQGRRRLSLLKGVATTIASAGGNSHEGAPPSTFAKVVVRDKNRRSRTIMRNANPSYAYQPDPIAISDPSAVIQIFIYTENAFGNMLLGQYATTLKQLCLDKNLVDGGKGIHMRINQDFLEFDAWLPLRDAKWRPFDIPEFEPSRPTPHNIAFSDVRLPARNTSTPILAKFTPRRPFSSSAASRREEIFIQPNASDGDVSMHDASLHDNQRRHPPGTLPNKSYGKDSKLFDQPGPNYPAIRVRLRWDFLAGLEAHDDSRKLTAMEHMKINSAETAARMGNIENIRAMLATFPFWLDCRGGFKIRGQAIAHVRDLFMGTQGSLEKQRKKRGGILLDKDWRNINRRAIKLSKIEVPFPCVNDKNDTNDDQEEDAAINFEESFSLFAFKVPLISPEKTGYLTLDGAMIQLIKGLFARILASGKVGSTILKILSAITSGAVAQQPSTYRLDSPASAQRLNQRYASADRQALGVLGLRGTRSDRQFALLFGLIQPSHKRLDARAIDDIAAPVSAVGTLLKASKRISCHMSCPKKLDKSVKWHKCRCVLRGATLFYFRVDNVRHRRGIEDTWQHVRAGEDHVVDLHRLVYDDTGSILRFVEDGNGDRVLELKVRRDDGDVYVIYFKESECKPPETSVKRIEAAAWNDGVYATIEDGLTSTLLEWRNAVHHALNKERAIAHNEIANLLAIYKHYQTDDLMSESKVHRLLQHTFSPDTKSSRVKPSASRLNGSWNMTRRSAQLDALLAAEGISFGTRVLSSAVPATLYIRVDDAQHCVIYCKDGFFSSRFYGSLNKPTRMLKVADNSASPQVLAIATLSSDGKTLLLSQASPIDGHVFFKCELHLRDNDTIEQRVRYSHADFSRDGLLFKKAGDFDLFSRLPPGPALEVELNAM